MHWRKTCLISPPAVAPSRPDFEVIGTFNPGAVRIGDTVHLLVRIAEQPIADSDFVPLPRYDGDGKLHVDHLSDSAVEKIDARVVIDRRGGNARLTSVSYLRHFTAPIENAEDPAAYVDTGGRFMPAAVTETMGVEDPRLTVIDGDVHFTYVSVSSHGACTSVATTSDFQTFDRHGVAFCNENKDVLLLPQKIDGRYAALHRPVSSTPFGAPEMWVAWSDDLACWGGHRPLRFVARSSSSTSTSGSSGSSTSASTTGQTDDGWDSGRVGGGTVPIRVGDHWISLFHGNARSDVPGQVGKYCGAMMACQFNDPSSVVATSGPVLVPDQSFETEGFVPGVVFPTAWIERDDEVLIFYGAADEHTAVAVANRQSLLKQLPLSTATA